MSINRFGTSHKNQSSYNVYKKYVDQKFMTLSTNLALKVDKSGDTMSGNLDTGGNVIMGLETTYPPRIDTQATSWSQVQKCVSDCSNLCWSLNGNDCFEDVILGTFDDYDINFIRNNKKYLTFNSSSVMLNKGLNANVHTIFNLANPVGHNDAANKQYVDTKRVKNNCGFIPPFFSASSKQGFIVTANGENGYAVFSNGNKEWVLSGINENTNLNGYLQIQLPFAVSIWKFALRGKSSDGERWFNWDFQGSNDGKIYTTIKSTNGDYLGNTTKFYTLAIPSEKYLYYRFHGLKAEPNNPGLSYIQIYSVDELI
jgi:hypothetical protein